VAKYKDNKEGCCWCGALLITGVIASDGEWFPFGFANCPTHTCWYEPGDEKTWIERQPLKEV